MSSLIKILGLIILFFLSSCVPSKQDDCATILRAKDKALLVEFEELIDKKTKGLLDDQQLQLAFTKLKAKEATLFAAVRQCNFKSPQDYNYWYRSRLKFPSPINWKRLMEREP